VPRDRFTCGIASGDDLTLEGVKSCSSRRGDLNVTRSVGQDKAIRAAPVRIQLHVTTPEQSVRLDLELVAIV
jgi:hypothetical protein